MKNTNLPAWKRPTLLSLGGLVLTTAAVADTWPATIYPLYEFGLGDLVDPHDVAVFATDGKASHVYVADRKGTAPGKLVRYSLDGDNTIAPVQIDGAFEEGPFGLAANDHLGTTGVGLIYATDHDGLGNGSLKVFINGGPYLAGYPFFGEPGKNFIEPMGIAVDVDGNVYVADRGLNKIQKFDASVFALGSWSSEAAPSAEFAMDYFIFPTDVSVDRSGRVHVASTSEVWVFESTGAEYGAFSDSIGGFVDAKDHDGNTWVGRPNWHGVRRWAWNLDQASPDVSSAFKVTWGARGVEYERYVDYSSMDTDCKGQHGTSSHERLFVSTPDRVQVYGVDASSVALPAGAIAWWRFDEDRPDKVSIDLLCGHNCGSHKGGPARVGGMVRYAREFDGVVGGPAKPPKNWIEVPDHPSLDFADGTGDFSIECWLRAKRQQGSRTFVDKRQNPPSAPFDKGYAMYLYNGQPAFSLHTSQGPYTSSHYKSGTSVADGKWHHVAVTVKRTGGSPSLKFYVDGAVVSTHLDPRAGDVNSDATLYIGRLNPAKIHPFLGKVPEGIRGALDELTIYESALTSDDIASIYAAGCAGKTGPNDQAVK